MIDQRKPTEDFDAVAPFEPLYEYIKTDKNMVWFYFEEKIDKLINWIGNWKHFDKDELRQEAYIFFHTLCEQYDPYYEGKFFPFDRYVFKNLIIKLRAYIQRYYFKGKREKPSDCDFLLQNQTVENIAESESDMYVDYIYSLLNPRQKKVIQMTLHGFKQQEIGKQLGISQSRVSVIKKNALRDLYMQLDEAHTMEEKREMQLEEIKDFIYERMKNHKGKKVAL